MKICNFAALAALSVLAACSMRTVEVNGAVLDVPTKNGIGSDWRTYYAEPIPASVSQGWHIHGVDVTVPERLIVNDRNVIAPSGDIVWHLDGEGSAEEKRAMIQSLVHDAVSDAATGLRGPTPIRIQVQVEKFHELSPRARYKLRSSGIAQMVFVVSVIHDRTKEQLVAPLVIEADTEALTGEQRIFALDQGETPKLRVERHIKATFASWLSLSEDNRREIKGRLGL